MQSLELPYMEDATPLLNWLDEQGFEVAEMGTKQFPGGNHWHIRKPNCTGTLELTHWPKEQRLWLTWRTNRMGEWIAELTQEIETFSLDR